MKNCVQAGSGPGSTVDQRECDQTSVGQLNQIWQFNSAPEPTSIAGDGQATAVGTVNAKAGILVGIGSAPFCSASSVQSYSGNKDWVLSAAHCLVNYGNGPVPWGTLVFKAGFDSRTSPPCVAYYFGAWIDLGINPAGANQDTAFLKVTKSYSCSTNALIGNHLHDDVGRFTWRWGAAPANSTLFSYNYPANMGRQQISAACANIASNLVNRFRVDCEVGPGSSGGGWVEWGTNNIYGTSNGIAYRDIFNCDYSPCALVRIPIVQYHYWHTAGTNSVWQGTT